MKRFAALFLLAAVAAGVHAAETERVGRDPNVLSGIDFEPALGTSLPLSAPFTDENGQAVTLGTYFTDKPVILVPVYYECPMLCTLSLNGLLRAARAVRPTAGDDYQIVAYSINPTEGPDLAMGKKETYVKGYSRGQTDGWHFLTGSTESINQLSAAINFKYVYDAASRQYAHASGLVIATPDGRISRALYGPEFAPRDLKLALAESKAGGIGKVAEKILLYCYAFDGSKGRYTMQVMNVMKLAGATTAIFLFTGVGLAVRREKKRAKDDSTSSGDPS